MSHQPALVGTLPERATIDAILSATGRQRQHLLDDFMRSKLRVFRSIGHTLCRNASMDVTRHLDEATAIVGAECVVMMNEIIADPTRLEKVTSFDGKLWVRCRPVFRTYCDSAAGGVNATGAIALSRRKREMGRMRESLRASYDREPTNEEIVEATNVKMNATRKNAARQAMVCSVESGHMSAKTVSVDNGKRSYFLRAQEHQGDSNSYSYKVSKSTWEAFEGPDDRTDAARAAQDRQVAEHKAPAPRNRFNRW